MAEKQQKKTAIKIHEDSWNWIKNLQHTRWIESGMKSQITQQEIIQELISQFDSKKPRESAASSTTPHTLDFLYETLQNVTLSTDDKRYIRMAVKVLTSGPDLFVQALKANLMAFSGEDYARSEDRPPGQGEQAHGEAMRTSGRIEEVGGTETTDRSDDAPLPRKKRARTKQYSPGS